jgi:hypothetical protein
MSGQYHRSFSRISQQIRDGDGYISMTAYYSEGWLVQSCLLVKRVKSVMTGQTSKTKQKYGYPPMLSPGEYPHGGLRTNSIHYGNSNHYSSSVFLFIGASSSHSHTAIDIHRVA